MYVYQYKLYTGATTHHGQVSLPPWFYEYIRRVSCCNCSHSSQLHLRPLGCMVTHLGDGDRDALHTMPAGLIKKRGTNSTTPSRAISLLLALRLLLVMIQRTIIFNVKKQRPTGLILHGALPKSEHILQSCGKWATGNASLTTLENNYVSKA